MAGLPSELKSAKNFHVHLGPYLIVGLKMGKVLNRDLGHSPFSFSLISYTGTRPPLSCIVDGLQLSTPCTVGNGGISIHMEGEAKVEAQMGKRRLLLSLREEIQKEIKVNCTSENMEEWALRIWKLSPEEMFDREEH